MGLRIITRSPFSLEEYVLLSLDTPRNLIHLSDSITCNLKNFSKMGSHFKTGDNKMTYGVLTF